jgi:hypothetical protein
LQNFRRWFAFEAFPIRRERVPNIEQGQEVGLWIREPFMSRRSLVSLIERPLARVLNAEPGGNDQEFPRRMFALGLQEHARPEWGQLAAVPGHDRGQ